MGKNLNSDSKIGQFLSCCTDLICLNILTLLCSLPLITLGPSLTAMYYVLYKLRRSEGGSIARSFFRSFKENFKQGMVLSLAFMLFYSILIVDYQLASRSESPAFRFVLYALPVVYVMGSAAFSWVFPLQSRYRNTVMGSVKCALAISIAHPGKTLLMIVINTLPVAALLATGKSLAVLIILGFSLPGYIICGLYRKIFELMETPSESDGDYI